MYISSQDQQLMFIHESKPVTIAYSQMDYNKLHIKSDHSFHKKESKKDNDSIFLNQRKTFLLLY